MSQVQNPTIIEALQKAAQGYGIPRIGTLLDKAPSTVYAELNPWTDRQKAKMGLEDAIAIMLATGDFDALRLIADLCGFRLEKKDAQPDKCLSGERLDDYAKLALANELIEQKEHFSLVSKALDEAIQDINETREAYRRFCEGGFSTESVVRQ